MGFANVAYVDIYHTSSTYMHWSYEYDTIRIWPVYTRRQTHAAWSYKLIPHPKEWRWFHRFFPRIEHVTRMGSAIIAAARKTYHRQPVCLVVLRREKRKVWINAMRGAT